MAFRFVTKENNFQVAVSESFSDIAGRDKLMTSVTEWFKMNAERYKIISDSISYDDHEPKHRIIRFIDREQHNQERVFIYYIEQTV